MSEFKHNSPCQNVTLLHRDKAVLFAWNYKRSKTASGVKLSTSCYKFKIYLAVTNYSIKSMLVYRNSINVRCQRFYMHCVTRIDTKNPSLMLKLRGITHDDVIKWKHFPRYWPFVRGIHRLPVNSQHKGQWRGDLMLTLICAWINCWANNGEAGDLRRYRAHYDVIVMHMTGCLDSSALGVLM